MIKFLSNTKTLRFFWGLLAFFLLNISIDVADATHPAAAEDLSFNEQESIVEFVLEQIIGIEDAIPESEDNDASQNSVLKKTTSIDYFIPAIIEINNQNIHSVKTVFFSHQHIFSSNSYLNIITPPPEV